MTRTRADWVGVVRSRPEHPRPDRRRMRWQSLDGEWQFALDGADEGMSRGWWTGVDLRHRIQVPYTFETALSGIDGADQVQEWVWYRRAFVVDRPASGRVLLHFGAVDWTAQVWVNGAPATSHVGGYAGFSCDITDLLRDAGEQEVVVRVHDPASPHNGGHQPRGKQRGSWRIWYTRTTGIWRSVWLEHVGRAWMDRPVLSADPASGIVRISPGVIGGGSATLLHAEVREGEHVVAAGSGAGDLQLKVHGHRLWSPEQPVLYEVRLRLLDGDEVLDEVETYVAFREVRVENGSVLLNGRPLFLRGVLDQGYWPDGGYTAPSQQALRRDAEAVRELGFNAVRKHVKVEDPHWYHWCDRLGLVVLQDMPSSQDLSTAAARDNFVAEWQEIHRELAVHPSILIWVLFNEDWGCPGRAFQSEVVRLTREMDPDRLVIDASGWITWGEGDLIDLHDYTATPGDLVAGAHGGQARIVGEFGGISFTGSTDGWGYSTADSPRVLVEAVAGLVGQLEDPARLAGWVYTQLTDVERETNGLLTAERRPKAPLEQLAAVVSGAVRPQDDVA